MDVSGEHELCCGLKHVPTEICRIPVNMTFFVNRAFVDVIQLRQAH